MDKARHAATRARLNPGALVDPHFRVRPGAKRTRGAETKAPTLSKLLESKSVTKSRQSLRVSGGRSSTKPGSKSAGGRAGSRLNGRGILGAWSSGHPRRQRVVVKARVVRNKGPNGRRTLPRHVEYIERDGVDQDGGRGQSFGRDGILSDEDVRQFVDVAHDDRHHFRLIVTPEHGGELPLRRYTQTFMSQVEGDLGTRLDWLAVEHHNTDHPHVHIIVRGVDSRGADLVINRAYISEGFRERAQGIATQELGLRAEAEVVTDRARELGRERLTYVDRRLIEEAGRTSGLVDVRRDSSVRSGFREEFRQQKTTRLRFLQNRQLAREVRPGIWTLAPNLEAELTARGETAALTREIKGTLGPRYRYRGASIYNKDAPPADRLVGEVLDRRRIAELSDSERLLVASTDGRVFRVPLSAFSEIRGEQARVGDIVAISVAKRAQVSAADRNIARIAADGQGVYDAERHRRWARQSATLGPEIDPGTYVDNHLKRLEGLERRGLVERLDAERFRVPPDLVTQIESAVAAARDGGIVKVERLSALTLKEQVRATGPTWLDTAIVRGEISPRGTTPVSSVERRLGAAARARLARLESRGIMGPGPAGLTSATLADLYRQDLAARGAALSAEFGRDLTASAPARYAGRVERIEQLSSGPHAVVRNDGGFVLIHASPALVQQRGRAVELDLGRSPSLERSIRFVSLDLAPRTRGLTR